MMEFISTIDVHLALTYFLFSVLNFSLSGFFGCSETVFLSLNRILLYAKHNKGDFTAKILIYLVERSSQFLTSVVIFNNITMIVSTLFMTKMFIEAFHVPILWVPFWTTLIMTPCSLLFAEVLPKSIGHPFADTLAYKFTYIWIVLYFMIYPIAWIFRKITSAVSYFCGFYEKAEQGIAQSEFQGLLDISLKSGALNTGEREFINNILEFREIQASEAMTPLSQIVCIEKNQNVYIALDLMKDNQVSILPVYDSRIDNPIGWIRAKNLINSPPYSNVAPHVLETFFVPETAYLEKVLIQMQKQKMPLSFVVDEYGGIVGILRVEDIVSEIVGEVIEAGDIEFKTQDDGSILSYGLCDIDDLFEELKLDISMVESKTLSGFMMEALGRMPQVGDIVYKKPWYFEVQSLKGRIVQEVVISRSIKKTQENNGER